MFVSIVSLLSVSKNFVLSITIEESKKEENVSGVLTLLLWTLNNAKGL